MLRAFFRGLARRITRAMVRRSVSRAISGVKGRVPRTMSEGSSRFVDEIEDMLDIFDLLDLAAEIPSIIANARDAANDGSASVFHAQMNSYNPGQKSLVENYCLPYVDEYWQGVDSPDPESFISGIYSTHEAIEQSLSDSCAQSYDAGAEAGLASIYQDLSIYVAADVAMRMADLHGKSEWGNGAMQDFGVEVNLDRNMIEALVKAGNAPSYYRYRYDEQGDFEYMKVRGSATSGFAERDLSWGQFMGSDTPYWHSEQSALLMAHGRGLIDTDTYLSSRDQLYNSTFNDPWATSRPAGYTSPYSEDPYTYTPPDDWEGPENYW